MQQANPHPQFSIVRSYPNFEKRKPKRTRNRQFDEDPVIPSTNEKKSIKGKLRQRGTYL